MIDISGRNQHVFVLTGLAFCFLLGDFAAEAAPVEIPDSGLRQAVEAALGKASGDVIDSDEMASLTLLSATSSDISDLTGLQYAVNLRELDVSANQIVDITLLAVLASLSHLEFSRNSITDLSPLTGLTNLRWLSIGDNQIVDMTPLAGLTNLTELHLNNNQVVDVSPVTRLTNLRSLSLGDNQIVDIAPLAGLTNLTHLRLHHNSIVDITPLVDLTNLTFLHLWRNSIVDITPLASLTNLTTLFLTSNQIVDIMPLSGLTNLTRLYVPGNQITDIAPLVGLVNLTELALSYNQIVNIVPLVGLDSLRWLWLDNNHIIDIEPLARLTRLTYLHLNNNQIVDITPLAGLTNLTGLHLNNNRVVDIAPLAKLSSLKYLHLNNNQIVNIAPLAELTRLKELHISRNEIEDISIVAELNELTRLDVTANPLDIETTSEVAKQLTERGVEFLWSVVRDYVDKEKRSARFGFDPIVVNVTEPNGVLVYFHGNASASKDEIMNSRLAPWYIELAREHDLVAVVIASPNSADWSIPYALPHPDGNSRRYWNYNEDLDLVHEMLQSDFDGQLTVDDDRVYLWGSSQGTCFLNRFVPRYGRYYRGGLFADCGCSEGLDPLFHVDRATKENFRVFVRAPTGDFLHKLSQQAYGYYKHIIGFETRADLLATGDHCTGGDVPSSQAIAWLLGDDAPADANGTLEPHFTRVSLFDRITGIGADHSGSLWVIQQEQTGKAPVASLWRSVDRGTSFELVTRLEIEVFDLDVVGDALFLTVLEGPILRSVDHGKSFQALDLNRTNAIGLFTYEQNQVLRRALGRPNETRMPALTVSSTGELLLIPINQDARYYLTSRDLGETWIRVNSPVALNTLSSETVYFEPDRNVSALSFPVDWMSIQGEADLVRLPSFLSTDEVRNVAWTGRELLAVRQFAYQSAIRSSTNWGASWTDFPLPDSAVINFGVFGPPTLSSLGNGEVLMVGGGSDGHIYHAPSGEWRLILGGGAIGWDNSWNKDRTHKVAVDRVRGDVFVTDGRGIFRIDASFRLGAEDIPAFEDRDSDGVPDNLDRFPDDETEYLDTDDDGIGNARDDDDDDDGRVDVSDAAPLDSSETSDLDGDGVGDISDNDRDGDGFVNSFDRYPEDSEENWDTDGDGIGDWTDLDDDNDGVPDHQDAFPKFRDEWVDADADFIGDNADPDPKTSALDSESSTTFARVYGTLNNINVRSIDLETEFTSDVIYPSDRGDFALVGRIVLGDAEHVVELMLATYVGINHQFLYLDRNGDADLTNDGPPLRLMGGVPTDLWFHIWVEVTYASDVSLPYGIHIRSIQFDTNHQGTGTIVLGSSVRATLTSESVGAQYQVAVVDADADGVFNGTKDLICIDLNRDGSFDDHTCGASDTNSPEQFSVNESITINGSTYKVSVTPPGYQVEFKAETDTLASNRNTKILSIPDAEYDDDLVDSQRITKETFLEPGQDLLGRSKVSHKYQKLAE